MLETDNLLSGDSDSRYTLRLHSGRRYRNHYYARGSEVKVDKETAQKLLDEGRTELLSIRFETPLRMHGRPIEFRKN